MRERATLKKHEKIVERAKVNFVSVASVSSWKPFFGVTTRKKIFRKTFAIESNKILIFVTASSSWTTTPTTATATTTATVATKASKREPI